MLYTGLQPHSNVAYGDGFSGNIYMAGFQPKLMGDILKNSNHVNFLIILDRGGYSVPHVTGSNVTVLNTVSDINDPCVKVDAEHLISYTEDSLYIPMVEGFSELSAEEKIQKYSSMSTMKKLIKYLEEG